MTFTKEWLQKAISDIETMRDEIPFGLDEDGNNTLAALKLALAGMGAEPVASPFGYLRVVSGRSFQIMEGPTRPPDRSGDCTGPWFPIWTSAPAPQPLTTSERAELENYRNAQQVVLTVWYGAMPESNGKKNWTVMLHRKGHHPWEGITINRSEYPGRTLYEADRMRFLIGEISEEPDCLAYDADEHSGYIAPLSGAVKDGWVMVPVEPTAEMYDAGDRQLATKQVWDAMIAAAPQQEA